MPIRRSSQGNRAIRVSWTTMIVATCRPKKLPIVRRVFLPAPPAMKIASTTVRCATTAPANTHLARSDGGTRVRCGAVTVMVILSRSHRMPVAPDIAIMGTSTSSARPALVEDLGPLGAVVVAVLLNGLEREPHLLAGPQLVVARHPQHAEVRHRLDLGGAPVFIAEGVFASELVGVLRPTPSPTRQPSVPSETALPLLAHAWDATLCRHNKADMPPRSACEAACLAYHRTPAQPSGQKPQISARMDLRPT